MMRPDEEKIEVMQAWLDGTNVKITSLSSGFTYIADNHLVPMLWNWETNDYSILRKPVDTVKYMFLEDGQLLNQTYDSLAEIGEWKDENMEIIKVNIHEVVDCETD